MSPPSEDRLVLLGVTGGVAAFKAVLLLRQLQRAGFAVQVLATASALRFIGEPTWHALSQRPVVKDVWAPGSAPAGEIHVELAARACAMVVYPATARFVGSLAAAITDDVVSLTASCMTRPLLVCPAMHTAMATWDLHAEAKRRLRAGGAHVLEPVTGPLASGEVGFGRLPEPEEALAALLRCLTPQDLAGRRVVVSAGPTREHVDPVRFLSNPSTGRMGFAVAEAAARRGAVVTLVAGPTTLSTPAHVRRVDVVSAAEMNLAVRRAAEGCDCVVMTAAVADFRPVAPSPRKLKKAAAGGAGEAAIALEPTTDILAGLGGRQPGRVLVGFAMETEDLEANARGKLDRKGLDLVVANDLHEPGAGFATATNVVTLVDRAGAERLPLMSKGAVADRILDRVVTLLG